MDLVMRKSDFVSGEQQRCRPAVYLHSLISAFIIHPPESILAKFAEYEIEYSSYSLLVCRHV